MEWIVRFELPNGGPGPETVADGDLSGEFDGIVVLLARDDYCRVSRDRATAYSEALDEFREEGLAVLTALPDGVDRAAFWRKRYDLDYPVVADPADGATADAASAAGASQPAMTDGTPRFDAFSDIETQVDSLPAIGVLNTASKVPRLVYSEGGETLQDCPDPDEALETALDVIE